MPSLTGISTYNSFFLVIEGFWCWKESFRGDLGLKIIEELNGRQILWTVMLIEMPRFSVAKLRLHHYKSDLAHISPFDSLVIGLSKSER